MRHATNPLISLLGRLRSLRHPVAVCAHRGDKRHAPENTMAAFRAAIEAGADMIELDVQRTADGELVVIHDAKLDRTTDGKGKIRDRELSEIRALDAGRWFGEEFEGERVPTLDEVLELLLAHDVVPLVEVKGRHRRVKGIEDPLGAVLRNQSVGDRIALIAHDRHVAEALRGSCDGAMISLLTFTKRNARFAARNGFHGVVPYWKSLSVKLIAFLHERELFLSPWTVNRRRDMRRLLDLGVDAIVTDDPALLRDTVDAWLDQRRRTPEPAPIEDIDLEQLDSDELRAPAPDLARLQWIRESGDSGDALTLDEDDEMDREEE